MLIINSGNSYPNLSKVAKLVDMKVSALWPKWVHLVKFQVSGLVTVLVSNGYLSAVVIVLLVSLVQMVSASTRRFPASHGQEHSSNLFSPMLTM